MELLESESDDIKRELLRRSALHRQQLEGDVKMISEKTQQALINALIVGGSLTLTYLLVRQLSGGKTKKKKAKARTSEVHLVHQPKTESVAVEEYEDSSPGSGVFAQIGTALMSQATVFLLSLAKEKLTEYLQSQLPKKAKENDHS